MSRPIGSREFSAEQIYRIVRLTLEDNSMSRREIAEEVGVSPRAVWRYQKYYHLV